MELALIDAIGPFFRGYQRRRINWSKIPFSYLATSGPERDSQWCAIRADLDVFAARRLGSASMLFRSMMLRIFPITPGLRRKFVRGTPCFARSFAGFSHL